MARGEFFLKKKREWTVFWVEAGVLIIVAVVLLLLLNYLNIISLSRYSSLFNFLPTKTPQFLSVDKDAAISATSQLENYKVSINRPQTLEQLFKKLKVTEKKAKEFKLRSLDKTIITLTNEKNLQYGYAYFDGTGTREFRYQFNVIDNTLVLFLYLPDKELDNIDVSQMFSRAVMYAVIKDPASKEITPLPSSTTINYLFTVQSLKNDAKTRAMPIIENENAAPESDAKEGYPVKPVRIAE